MALWYYQQILDTTIAGLLLNSQRSRVRIRRFKPLRRPQSSRLNACLNSGLNIV